MHIAAILILLLLFSACPSRAEENLYALNLYTAQMTNNNWEDFFTHKDVEARNSYLLAFSLARTIGQWRDRLTYEIEGQLAKHFGYQSHWEVNLLGVLRWQKLPWDNWLDSSIAFGIGPSYATKQPEIEIENDKETARVLVYWMLELALVPFAEHPDMEVITRIHHRSNAYGLIAEDGGSNALAIGLKYRF